MRFIALLLILVVLLAPPPVGDPPTPPYPCFDECAEQVDPDPVVIAPPVLIEE